MQFLIEDNFIGSLLFIFEELMVQYILSFEFFGTPENRNFFVLGSLIAGKVIS